MNIATKAGLAAGSLTAVLLLAGCNLPGSASGSPSPPGSNGTAAPATVTVTASAPSAPSSNTPATPAASGTGSASAAGSSDACSGTDTTVSEGIGGGPGSMSNGDASLNFVFASSQQCVLDGYPGVDVIGDNKDTGQTGERLSIPRDNAGGATKIISGGSGQGGQFEFEYMPGSSSVPSFSVTQMIVTPPGSYSSTTYNLKSPILVKLKNNQIDAELSVVGPAGTNSQ